jgi:hypothetical protein
MLCIKKATFISLSRNLYLNLGFILSSFITYLYFDKVVAADAPSLGHRHKQFWSPGPLLADAISVSA